jgi:hexosaminidase
MHLDVGRHFFPVEFIKKYIDLLASYKLNTFHWHLTEDQGWRIEIKKYPRLTEIGSKRKDTTGDGTPYGGFYTQEQIREVVKYANERFVAIVPEIEMPGHSLAALTAYPELSCTGGPFEVGTKWGVFEDVYCAGNEKTFNFLKDVLNEVIALFPGKYIHIGGDECPKNRWKVCAKCQRRMKVNNLKSEEELQSYFIRKIDRFLASKGRKLVGWDEILEGGLSKGAAVMSWRGTEGGIAAAKSGHDVVMTPTSHCYFDYYQGIPEKEPKAIGGFIPIDTVYLFEPVPPSLPVKQAKYILGAQGNVWTEYIADEKHAEYMVLPRLLAMSEVVWSDKNSRNFEDFKVRLEGHFPRLSTRGYNFRKPAD